MGITSILVQSDIDNINTIDKNLFDKELVKPVMYELSDHENENIDVMRILGYNQHTSFYVNEIGEDLKIKPHSDGKMVYVNYEIIITSDSDESTSVISEQIHNIFAGNKDYIENYIVVDVTRNIIIITFLEDRKTEASIQFYK